MLWLAENHFVGKPIELSQRFALHLQLHLGILLHNLRVAPAKHLSYPFVCYTAGAEPSRVGGAKVVDPEVWNGGFL